MSLTKTAEWQQLQTLFTKHKDLQLRHEFQADSKRFEKLNIQLALPDGSK